MRNKILLALILVMAMAGMVFADATPTTTLTPKSGKLDFMSGGAVAVTDQDSGYTQQVTSEGAAFITALPNEKATVTGTDAAAVSNACRVTGVYCSGTSTVAGSAALIYDAASATGDPVFECTVGTAKETNSIVIPQGVQFDTGVYVSQSANDMTVTITYDD